MKKSTIFTLLAALFLAVIAIIFFYPDDLQGRVLQQHDIQQGLANGHEGQLYFQQTGERTRWTNALFSGMPTFQISPSYPANTLLTWIGKLYTLYLPDPAGLLFGMMLGFFIMCLCLKMKWQTSLFGAIAWGLSSYFIIIIGAGHIWKFMTLMYIPPTIGGLALAYRGKYLQGTALASLFGALQLMSNHIQMSYYFIFVVIAMLLAWLWEAIKNKKMKQWGIATLCMLGAAIIAIAANAPSLYNTYTYSKETTRGKSTEIVEANKSTSSGPDINYITQWSYGKNETWSLLIPNIKGGANIKPQEGGSKMLTLADTDKAQDLYSDGKINSQEYQFLSQFPQYFGDQPMTNGPVYVGAFVLLLALLAMFTVKNPMKWALFAASILTIMLSWGHNMMWLTEIFVNGFPAYANFRTVSSMLVVAEFCIPLLACMVLAQIIKDKDWFKKYATLWYTIMGLGAAVCLIGWLIPSAFGSPFSAQEKEMLAQAGVYSKPEYANILNAIKDVRLSMVSADALRSFGFIILGSIAMLLYFCKVYKSPKLMSLLIAGVALIDLYSVNKRYVDSDNFTDATEPHQTFAMNAADKAILTDTAMNYRVMDFSDFGGARSSYFHKTIGGYHAAKLTRYQDIITHQLMLPDGPNINVLNMLNAKYFLQGDQYEQNPQAYGNAWFIDSITYTNGPNAEMDKLSTLKTRNRAVADKKFETLLGQPSPIATSDTIYETSYAPNKLTYHAQTQNGGIATFSEVYFPWGWNATIDGKPTEIGRVNYILRALRIPAGQHTIEMTFDPQSSKNTDLIAYCGLALIYLSCGGALTLVGLHTVRKRNKK